MDVCNICPCHHKQFNCSQPTCLSRLLPFSMEGIQQETAGLIPDAEGIWLMKWVRHVGLDHTKYLKRQ